MNSFFPHEQGSLARNDLVGFMNSFFSHEQGNLARMNKKTKKKNPQRDNLGSNPKITVCKARLK